MLVMLFVILASCPYDSNVRLNLLWNLFVSYHSNARWVKALRFLSISPIAIVSDRVGEAGAGARVGAIVGRRRQVITIRTIANEERKLCCI